MEQVNWRGMLYFDALWRKRHLTRRELRAVYGSSYTIFFWIINISILVLLDLHGFSGRVSFTALVIYATSITVMTFMLYFLACEIGINLSRRYSRFYLILPLVGIVAATVSTYIVELGMTGTFGGGVSIERAAEKLPVNVALTLVLETFYLTFVLPIAVKSYKFIKRRRTSNEKKRCETLVIAGKTIFCDHLLSISSQDHYVRIRTNTEEVVVRARLSDIIGQLDSQGGIQPHRSHWVARRAVSEIITQTGHKMLELNDGSKIPIARGRMVDVQAWLENGRG